MKTANEMRAITEKANANFTAAEREKAIKYTENYIFPQINNKAINGQFEVYFHVDSHIKIQYVVEILIQFGYTTEVRGSTIKINW